MKAAFVALLIALSPLGLRDAYADSDGYYCIGRGYLAYQFGMNVPQNPPRVSVLRTDVSGIPAPIELRLPPFQVGRMRCGDGWVDIAAFDTVYRVILDGNTHPVRYESRPLPAESAEPSAFPPVTRNLATLSTAAGTLRTERIALGATDRGTNYELVITATIIPPAEQCRTAITTRVVETDRSSGRELASRIVFKGGGHRECGE